jgi:hypothetical protein
VIYDPEPDWLRNNRNRGELLPLLQEREIICNGLADKSISPEMGSFRIWMVQNQISKLYEDGR